MRVLSADFFKHIPWHPASLRWRLPAPILVPMVHQRLRRKCLKKTKKRYVVLVVIWQGRKLTHYTACYSPCHGRQAFSEKTIGQKKVEEA